MQECIDRYSALVWSLARRFTSTQADAEDAVQEIFTDVWRSSGRFDPTIAGESTFIAMIARRRLIDRLNRQGRRLKPVAMPDENQVGESKVDASEQGQELTEEFSAASEAFEQLSDDQQRVLRLSIQQGYTHAQIAEITGMPLGTVKTHIRRGLIRAREIIDEIRGTAGTEVAL